MNMSSTRCSDHCLLCPTQFVNSGFAARGRISGVRAMKTDMLVMVKSCGRAISFSIKYWFAGKLEAH